MADLQDLIFSARRPGEDWQRLLDFASRKNVRSEQNIEMYGFGSILRRICGLPQRWPLNLKSQHGVSLWTVPIAHEMAAPERYLLVHSKRWENIYHGAGNQRAVAIGSPFVMYRRNLLQADVRVPVKPTGAIFYLSHSTFWEQAQWQTERLFPALQRIQAEHGRLTVCVHFVDVLNGVAKSIFDAGFDVAISGNYYNTDFPRNFYRLLLSHELVYTNAVGSHVFYAVEAGKDVRWVDLPATYVNIGYTGDEWKEVQRDRPIEVEVMNCLKAGAGGADLLAKISGEELGLDAMVGRTALLCLIARANVYWHLTRRAKQAYRRVARRA